MSSPRDIFADLLKKHGYSLTRARVAVFSTLLGQEPMTMHQVVTQARGVDRASVYRAIDLFEKLGIVQRLNTGWKYKLELTDSFVEHHHHLTCTQCGRTIPLNEQRLELFIEQLAFEHGFKPSGHQIEIQGVCGNCSEERAS